MQIQRDRVSRVENWNKIFDGEGITFIWFTWRDRCTSDIDILHKVRKTKLHLTFKNLYGRLNEALWWVQIPSTNIRVVYWRSSKSREKKKGWVVSPQQGFLWPREYGKRPKLQRKYLFLLMSSFQIFYKVENMQHAVHFVVLTV